MPTSSRWRTLGILVLLGNAPLLLGTGLLWTRWGESALASLGQKIDGFAAVAAASEFSMLGFLAAIMALFSLIGQSEAMRRYRINGYLWVLLALMAVTMAEISIAFCLSLALFFPEVSPGSLSRAFIALCGSLGMLVVCLSPCVGLQLRAAREP